MRAACSREIEMMGSSLLFGFFRCKPHFIWLNIFSGFHMCLRVSSRFSGCLNELNVLQLLWFFLFLVQALPSSCICLCLWLPSSFQLGHVSWTHMCCLHMCRPLRACWGLSRWLIQCSAICQSWRLVFLLVGGWKRLNITCQWYWSISFFFHLVLCTCAH